MLGDRLCCLLWGTVYGLNVVEVAKVAFLDSVPVVQIVSYLYDFQVMEWLPRNCCCGAVRIVGFFAVPQLSEPRLPHPVTATDGR